MWCPSGQLTTNIIGMRFVESYPILARKDYKIECIEFDEMVFKSIAAVGIHLQNLCQRIHLCPHFGVAAAPTAGTARKGADEYAKAQL